MQRAKPGWKPSARRQFTEVASTERAIARHGGRLAELGAKQDAHDRFAVEHAAEFEQARVLGLATSARRLTIRITAVADPQQAALDLLGPRTTTQRERLRWDDAVENPRCISMRAADRGTHERNHSETSSVHSTSSIGSSTTSPPRYAKCTPRNATSAAPSVGRSKHGPGCCPRTSDVDALPVRRSVPP